MKIQGSVQKINPLYALFVAVGLLCVAIPFRTYQVLSLIESETGFFAEVNWSVYLIYSLCVVAFLVTYILVFFAKDVPESRAVYRKNRPLAAASIVLGIGIGADAVIALANVVLSTQGLIFTLESFVPTLLQGVFGILSVIYIFVFGISYFDGRTTYSRYKLLALCPVIWSAARLVIRFVEKISYINVSDLMLELFGLAFMMIFFMGFARISSGLANKKAMRSVFSAGIVSAFLFVLANVPRLVAIASANGSKLVDKYPFSLCDLAFGIFAVCYILNAMNTATKNDAFELLEDSNEDIAPITNEDIIVEEDN